MALIRAFNEYALLTLVFLSFYSAKFFLQQYSF